MIVTFHIAVQLVYYIWENVKSVIFTPADSIHGTNDTINDSTNETVQSGKESDEISYGRLVEPYQCLPGRPRDLGCISTSTYENAEVNEDLPEHEDYSHSDCFNGECNSKDLIYNIEPKFECICKDGIGIRFVPPVYTQRYMVIDQILNEPCWASTVKKIVDFGCAELKFESVYLKKLEGISEIISVDIDEDLLRYNSCRLVPSIPDYLQPRSSPLTVKIFCGSVANTNEVLIGCDAVVAIELIEHLYPLDLEDLPFTVFGFIQPRIAIFTTPNADFNILFTNFSGFRHPDHKFEWSRQEFEDWGNNLVMRYPDYTVTYQGIGPGPAGTEHLGCCSQMAIFVKLYNSHSVSEDELHIQDGNYKLINEYVHPYDERTREEKIRDDAISFINKQISLSRHYHDIIIKEVPLKDVMRAAKCYSRVKLMNILSENNWEIGKNEAGYDIVIVPENDSEDESNLDDEYYDQDQGDVLQTGYSNVEENWDSDEKELEYSPNHDLESCNDWGDSTIRNNTCYDSMLYGFGEQCLNSGGETCIESVHCEKDQSDMFSEKESEKDCSIYETPFSSNNLQIKRSKNELLNNPSKHSMYCNQIGSDNGSSKALTFEKSQNYNDSISKTEPFCCVSNVTIVSSENDRNESFFSLDSVDSPLNSSPYTTPCCSKHHNICAPKSFSLEQINVQCSSSFCTGTSRLPGLNSEQRVDMSKSMECLETHDSCNIQDTCSNVSKILDSGYPDSCSEHNIELDLTLEQFDEIETESDENYESSSPPMSPVQAQRAVEHVENGDVVNNNRDGEGNNVVADMEEDPLEFEVQIEELNNAVPNLEGAYELIQCSSMSNSPGGGSSDMEEDHFKFESQIEDVKCDIDLDGLDDENVLEIVNRNISPDERFPKDCSVPNTSTLAESCDSKDLTQHHICSRSNSLEGNSSTSPQSYIDDSKSALNLASNSLCHLDSLEKTASCCHENTARNGISQESFKSKSSKPSSIATVVDDCTKCESLLIQQIYSFPKWLINIDGSIFDGRSCDKELIEQDLSSSDCESTRSLQSASKDISFPTWLLNILLSETEDYDVESTNSESTTISSEVDSDDEQFDPRAGGDQHIWH